MIKLNLQLKLILLVIPLMIVGPIIVGYWSIQTSKARLLEDAYKLIQIQGDSFVADQVERRYQILQDNNLLQISQYTKHYQQEIKDLIMQKPTEQNRNIAIHDTHTNIIIMDPNLSDLNFSYGEIIKVLHNTAEQGVLTFQGAKYLFYKTTFPRWNWEVYKFYNFDKISKTIDQIVFATAGVCLFSATFV
ncbi:MAG: hypothetical protein OXT67_05745, partial [Zetaproteobacteria bacterium]|nr:hypothetical protein [Zetaproteobacteria bacterium]